MTTRIQLQKQRFNSVCTQLSASKQSPIICSICCFIGIISIFVISSKTFPVNQNTGYATTIQIPITNTSFTNPFKEWQFTKNYIPPNDRLITPIYHWIISTLFIIIIYTTIWLLLFFMNPNNTHEWLLDDLISFSKGYILSIFICHSLFVLLSTYISLPIPSYYDLCNFNVYKNKCLTNNKSILQEAYSSFPNPTMGLLISSLGYLSFWLSGKFIQLLYSPSKTLCEQNYVSIHTDNLYGYFNSYLSTSLHGILVIIIPFIPLYFGIAFCTTLVSDNMASTSDFNGTIIATLFIVYYIYIYYYESPFDCLDISYNMLLAGLPKQCITYQNTKLLLAKIFHDQCSAMTSIQIKNNESDSDVEMNEYCVRFKNKPFGMTFTNKYNKSNLYIKQVELNSFAQKNGVIAGSKIIKFENEIVENKGGKNIQQIFMDKYMNELPLCITFRKPNVYGRTDEEEKYQYELIKEKTIYAEF